MTDEILGNRYSNEQFLTFLKVGETLYCARDALSDLCKREMDEFHKDILIKCKVDQNKEYKHTCDAKGINELKTSCPAGICKNMMKEVGKALNSSKSVYWSNTELTKWPTDSWEIAKVFMGPGQKPENTGPLETDSSGIFHLIRNCGRFKKYNITEKDIDELIKKRNAIAHAAVPWFSDEDLDSNITFLQDFFERLSNEQELKENEKHAMKAAVEHLNQLTQADFKKYFTHKEKEIFDHTVKELLHDVSYQIDHLLQMFGQFSIQETMQGNGEFKAKMENFLKAMLYEISSSRPKTQLQDLNYDVHMIYCDDHANDAKKLKGILQNVFEVKNEPLRICMDVEDEGDLGFSKVDLLDKAVKSKCIFVLCNKNQTKHRANVAVYSAAAGDGGRAVPLRLSNSSCLDTRPFIHPEIDISPLVCQEVLGNLTEEQNFVLKQIEQSLK